MSNKDHEEYKNKREREIGGGVAGGIAGGLLINQGYKVGQRAYGKRVVNAMNSSPKFDSDYHKVVKGMTHVKDIAGGTAAGGHSIYRTPTGKDIIITRGGDAAVSSFSSRGGTNDTLRPTFLKTLRGDIHEKDIVGIDELKDYIRNNKDRQINIVGTSGNSSVLLHELGHTAGTRHGTASGSIS